MVAALVVHPIMSDSAQGKKRETSVERLDILNLYMHLNGRECESSWIDLVYKCMNMHNKCTKAV